MTSERRVKQVIVMRTDLNMRKGKMIAQGAHASMAFMTKHAKMRDGWEYSSSGAYMIFPLHPDHVQAAIKWIEGSFTKIAVKANSDEHLFEVYQNAKDANLPVEIITDTGATEFNGVPTITCIAIGPTWSDLIDPITKDLVLL